MEIRMRMRMETTNYDDGKNEGRREGRKAIREGRWFVGLKLISHSLYTVLFLGLKLRLQLAISQSTARGEVSCE